MLLFLHFIIIPCEDVAVLGLRFEFNIGNEAVTFFDRTDASQKQAVMVQLLPSISLRNRSNMPTRGRYTLNGLLIPVPILPFESGDQIYQVLPINVDIYDRETVAEFFIPMIYNDELDGIHSLLYSCNLGFRLMQ